MPYTQIAKRQYFGYGMRIRSDVPLLGASLVDDLPLSEEMRAAAELRVRVGQITEAEPAKTLGIYSLRADGLLADVPDVARYLCLRKGGLWVDRVRDAHPQDVHDLLIATALPAMLWLQGQGVVIHAATFMLPNTHAAIAIAGASGMGKSTVLQGLLERGATVVGDDTAWVTERHGRPWVSGLPGCVRARVHRSPLLHGSAVHGDRQEIAVPVAQQVTGAELAGVCVLERTLDAPTAAFDRIHGVEALYSLIAHLHRPRVPRLLGRDENVLQYCAQLASRVGVYRWRRTSGSEGLEPSELQCLLGIAMN